MILRLRSALNTINLHYCDRRVLIVCHQVVVLCMRYILEELTSRQSSTSTSRPRSSIAASALTTSSRTPKGLCVPTLDLWNHGAPLEAEGAPKTSAPDAMAGTR